MPQQLGSRLEKVLTFLNNVLAAHAPGFALLQTFIRWSGIAVDDLTEIDP